MSRRSQREVLSVRAEYRRLLARYGPQGWWPGRTRAEIIIGAILTQNTAWANVRRAISNLRKNRALNFQALEKTSPARLAKWIRPAGYFNQKTVYLKAFAAMLRAAAGGSPARLFREDTPALRRRLLAVKGIGPETADSILLYAAGRPVFVVDAYTRRFLAARGLARLAAAAYDDIADFFIARLPRDARVFNEYHALLVRWGKDHPARVRSAG